MTTTLTSNHANHCNLHRYTTTATTNRKTPIALNTLGLLLIAGAGALALLPDSSTAEFVGQAAGATVLVASALAIFVASSLLDALQKP